MEWNKLALYILVALVGIAFGYVVGGRHSRRVKKRVLHQFNTQSLELLDARSSLKELNASVNQQKRTEEALRLSHERLTQSNKLVTELRRDHEKLDKKNYVELTRMRLRAVEAHETARKAINIARKATLHLRRLEKASPVTQTIKAHEPKSYGNGAPVTVSVVDQARLDGSPDGVAQVTNRDSARLSKLHSSNEATAS